MEFRCNIFYPTHAGTSLHDTSEDEFGECAGSRNALAATETEIPSDEVRSPKTAGRRGMRFKFATIRSLSPSVPSSLLRSGFRAALASIRWYVNGPAELPRTITACSTSSSGVNTEFSLLTLLPCGVNVCAAAAMDVA